VSSLRSRELNAYRLADIVLTITDDDKLRIIQTFNESIQEIDEVSVYRVLNCDDIQNSSASSSLAQR
jgi:hypothetical protein